MQFCGQRCLQLENQAMRYHLDRFDESSLNRYMATSNGMTQFYRICHARYSF